MFLKLCTCITLQRTEMAWKMKEYGPYTSCKIREILVWLTLGNADIWARRFFAKGGCPVCRRRFRIFPPVLTTGNASGHCPVSLGPKSAPLENRSLKGLKVCYCGDLSLERRLRCRPGPVASDVAQNLRAPEHRSLASHRLSLGPWPS